MSDFNFFLSNVIVSEIDFKNSFGLRNFSKTNIIVVVLCKIWYKTLKQKYVTYFDKTHLDWDSSIVWARIERSMCLIFSSYDAGLGIGMVW